jgi:hypothetical protein
MEDFDCIADRIIQCGNCDDEIWLAAAPAEAINATLRAEGWRIVGGRSGDSYECRVCQSKCPECTRSNGPHYTGPCEH